MEKAHHTTHQATNPNSAIYRSGLNENLTVKVWPELLDQLQSNYEAEQSKTPALPLPTMCAAFW